jgi:hypothetical protein
MNEGRKQRRSAQTDSGEDEGQPRADEMGHRQRSNPGGREPAEKGGGLEKIVSQLYGDEQQEA